MKTTERIPITFVSKLKPNDAEDVTWVAFYQKEKSWRTWLKYTSVFADDSVKIAISMIENDGIPQKNIKNLSKYVLDMYSHCSARTLKKLISVLEQKAPKVTRELTKESNLMVKIGATTENPIEEYAHINNKIPINDDIGKRISQGVFYADGSGLCSKELVQIYIAQYDDIFKRCTSTVHGDMGGQISVLDKPDKLVRSKFADTIADALDKNELSKLIERFAYSTLQYRTYILAYTSALLEESVTNFTKRISSNKRGHAKERYWAISAHNAFIINNTKAAAEYFDKCGELSAYASIRGYKENDYRDTVMISEFGMDETGVRRFDIGETVIAVSLNDELKFKFIDETKGKEIKSFPKKSNSETIQKNATDEFKVFKKSVEDFIKARTYTLKRLYLEAGTVPYTVWYDVYYKHSVVKKIARLLVWMDINKNTFILDEKYNIVDVTGKPYRPKGNIKLAHIFDLTGKEINMWQNYLVANKQKLLIPQMWEVSVAKSITNQKLQNRYNGVVITQVERNAFKKRMRSYGIDFHTENGDLEYNYHNNTYAYYDDVDMKTGNSLVLNYSVDDISKDITFNSFSQISKKIYVN